MAIIIRVKNASYAEVLKNPYHHELIKSILSYSITYRRGENLVRSKGSFFRYSKFGLGLMPYIKEKLDSVKESYIVRVPFKFEPLNIKETKNIKLNGKELEDYQIKVLNCLDKKIKRGIIQAPTAAGKTTIAAAIIDKFNRPKTLIVTPTKDIARNTVKSLEKDLQIEIGLIGDQVCLIEDVTVCLYQSLRNIISNENYKKFRDFILNTQLIIWDEAHIASKAIDDCLSPFINTFYRFGLTATPKLKYKKQMYLEITGQLGPVIVKITEKQASKRVVNEVKSLMWNFYHTPEYSEYMSIYRHDVLLNIRRCKLLCEMIRYSFKEEGRFNCLLLVDEYAQAKLIKRYADKMKDCPNPVIVWSGISTEEAEDIKRKLNTGEIPFVIATPKFSVGTDIPEIETIVIGSARKSIANLTQKIGRGRRKTKGKSSLLLMDVFDVIGEKDKYFEKYSISRKNFYIRKRWFIGVKNGDNSI